MPRYRAGAGKQKYHAKPTTVDGIRFASQAEARYYGQLKMLEKAGQLRHLELQPRFPLEVAGKTIATYVADFKYELANGPTKATRWEMWITVIADVKGMLTPMYRLKRKWMKAQYGIEITEVA